MLNKPPYSYEQWIITKYGSIMNSPVLTMDVMPEIVYDGYIQSLQDRGYTVYGDCYRGITVGKTA